MWRTAATVALAMSICSPVSAREGLTASLERLTAEGDAEAAYHVGMADHTGSGVERDYAKALAAFRQTAAGDPLGAYKVGCYHAAVLFFRHLNDGAVR